MWWHSATTYLREQLMHGPPSQRLLTPLHLSHLRPQRHSTHPGDEGPLRLLLSWSVLL